MHQADLSSTGIFFITTVTKNRRRIFYDRKLGTRLMGMIMFACKIKQFTLLAYCIMPDHIHLLVHYNGDRVLEKIRSGEMEEVFHPVSTLVQCIKGSFSRTLLSGHIWQRRYYLRCVENEIYLWNLFRYIRNNHKKANLPEWYGQEPFWWQNNPEIENLFL